MSVDIFKEGKELSVGFFSFKDVGDCVQGTYVKKQGPVVSGKFGTEQIIYTLKTDTGLINVGFKTTVFPVHEKMQNVKFGQIVGFKYVESRDVGKGNKMKIYSVHADPKIVDKEWLAENNAPIVATAAPNSDMEALAIELAKSKFNTTDVVEARNKAEFMTGLKFVTLNYPEIISKLNSME